MPPEAPLGSVWREVTVSSPPPVGSGRGRPSSEVSAPRSEWHFAQPRPMLVTHRLPGLGTSPWCASRLVAAPGSPSWQTAQPRFASPPAQASIAAAMAPVAIAAIPSWQARQPRWPCGARSNRAEIAGSQRGSVVP